MTFYAAGSPSRIRRSAPAPASASASFSATQTAGMSHDFAIRSWRVTTNLLKGKGEDSVEFTVPDGARLAHLQLQAARGDDARNV